MANKQLPNKNLHPRIMTYWQTVLCLVLITILCGCAMEQGKASQNRWISLFNGKNLEGWTVKIAGHELNDNYGNTFRVEDGILKVSYDQYEKFDGKFGHLFYKDKFSDYILRVQYRFVGDQTPGGPGWAFRNSGIMLHSQSAESMAKNQSFPVSIEAQLLGGNGKDERSTGNVCTPGTHIVMDGQLVTRHCIPSLSKTYHNDQWVTMEIEVHGNSIIKHIVNGQVVLEYEKPQLDENDPDAQKLIVNGEKMLHEGYIVLQAESHPVEFRKVEVLPLVVGEHTPKPVPPVAKKVPKRFEKHGHVRIDNYYWLKERDNPEAVEYLKAENEYTDSVMAHTEGIQQTLFEEFKGRIKQTDMSVPYEHDDYYYYIRHEEGKEYPIYCRKRGALENEEEIMLNVNELAEGHEFISVRRGVISYNQDLLAYAVDTVGRRIYTIRFKDLVTGDLLEDEIPQVTGNVAWANDNKTVFYTKQDPVTLRSYRVYRHVLGTDSADDKLVFEESDDTFSCYVYKTKSKRYVMIMSVHTLSTEYRYVEADDPAGEFKIFLPRKREHEYFLDHYKDHFYVVTNDQAKNFRLMMTSVNQTSQEHWKELIPHRKDVLLEGIEIFRDYLVVIERQNVLLQLRVKPWNGQDEHYLDFGEPAYLAYASDNFDFDTSILRYTYSSLTTPRSVYDYDMATRQKTLLKQKEVLGGFDSDNYRSERLYARAKDGVKIPISVVYRQELKKDGTNPLLLYGYGSYGASIDAAFNPFRVSLLDRGFVFAIAHIRGGQELGRQWYEDGKLLKKKNTFTDFIACAEHLVAEKYTCPDKLSISGGSAGGLLIGVVVNMRPDLFQGAVAAVPFVDVITTMLDESIPLTTNEYDEWGNPNKREYYDYMLSYSPYDNVEKKDYPNTLVITSLRDSQVQYWEPAKWVAKLRALKTNNSRLLLRTYMEAGHGGVSGRYKKYHETAFIYAFLIDLAGKGVDVNTRDEEGKTALHLAAPKRGNQKIVKLLLAHGADVNAQDKQRCTPALAALYGWKLAVTDLLLEKGADAAVPHLAAYTGDLSRIKKLLDADSAVGNYKGLTLLHAAAAGGQVELVKYLIGKGLDVKASTEDGLTPLHYAAFANHQEVAEILIVEGAQVDAGDITPLLFAALEGQKDMIEYLISKGADIHKGPQTALHTAVLWWEMDAVKLLVEHGADLNAQNDVGNTPLHAAVNTWWPEVAEVLLSHGAKIDLKNNQGQTPLLMATGYWFNRMIRLLVEKGADINAQNNVGRTAIDIAITQENTEIVHFLEAKGAANTKPMDGKNILHRAAANSTPREFKSLFTQTLDISLRDAKDRNGFTPLHCAILFWRTGNAKLLIDKGAYLNIQDNDSYTPLHYAAWQGMQDVAELLIDRGTNLNIQDNWGWTPLHRAVIAKQADIAKILIEEGADTNIKDKEGRTPLWWAEDLGLEGFVNQLKKESKAIAPSTVEPDQSRRTQSPISEHDIAITDVSISSNCIQGDSIPITISISNQGAYRETFNVILTDQTNGKEIASQEVTLAKAWKDESKDVADVIFDAEETGIQQFGDGIWSGGDINGDGLNDILICAPRSLSE